MIDNSIDTEILIMEEVSNEMGLEVCDVSIYRGSAWVSFVGTALVGMIYRTSEYWEYNVRMMYGDDVDYDYLEYRDRSGYYFITYQDVEGVLKYIKKRVVIEKND